MSVHLAQRWRDHTQVWRAGEVDGNDVTSCTPEVAAHIAIREYNQPTTVAGRDDAESHRLGAVEGDA